MAWLVIQLPSQQILGVANESQIVVLSASLMLSCRQVYRQLALLAGDVETPVGLVRALFAAEM
jgi:hypothetical protein